MTTSRAASLSPSANLDILAWINRALEAIWLTAIVLVPLAYLDRDYISSEAIIAYVEVPKVALLRTLAGLIVVLWLVEWALRGRFPQVSAFAPEGLLRRPAAWLPSLWSWLKVEPTRWLFLAVWFFLGTTLLSTIFSGQIGVSVWGEVPGQDGYAAYTIVAYVTLFAVIATHLKTPQQLWRLLGAVAIMGTLVAAYAIFQHYGNDFLNLTETTGGGTRRVTAFMGNAIFAAAVMLMTIPITLMAALASISRLKETELTEAASSLWSAIQGRAPAYGLLALWAAIIAVQVLGLTFTFSRGPWVGTLFAMAVALGSVTIFVGRRAIFMSIIVLGLAASFALALIEWQASISIPGLGPWISPLIALAGFVGAVILIDFRLFGRHPLGRLLVRIVVVIGVATAIIAVVFLIPKLTDDGGGQSGSSAAGAGGTASDVAERFRSIKSDVLGGVFSGRVTHWRVSWTLIKDHPWPDFASLSVPWLRPLVGYGPDLFRYTYLLESQSEGVDHVPLEPDHAHNFFVHQTVEQGYLGLLSSLGIFAAVFWVGGVRLLRQRRGFSTFHALVIIAVVAFVAGRFLEMMVGVARISDLTILWVMLGVLAALPAVMRAENNPSEQLAGIGPDNAPARLESRRSRRRRNPTTEVNNYDWQLFWRLAVVAVLIGGIAMFTWFKSVDYVRAAASVGEALTDFRQGDLQSTLTSLDRAIDLAPDVFIYYNHRASVYLTYRLGQNFTPEMGCNLQNELPYRVCLAAESFQNNLDGESRRPFYYRSQVQLANAAFNLGLTDESVRFYRNSVALIPDSWLILNELASSHLDAGQPEEALRVTAQSLEITAESSNENFSAVAHMLRGIAYKDLGQWEKAVESLELSLSLRLTGNSLIRANRSLAEVQLATGKFQEAIVSLNNNIEGDIIDPASYQLRGQANNELGKYRQAARDYETVLELDPQFDLNYAQLGISYYFTGQFDLAQRALDRAIRRNPDDTRSLAYRGNVYGEQGQTEIAFETLNQAVDMSPDDPVVRYLRGVALFKTSQLDKALEDLSKAIELEPESPEPFVTRGHTLNALGLAAEAKEDYATAIRIRSQRVLPTPDMTLAEYDAGVQRGPENPAAYDDRGSAHYRLGQYQQAILDFDQAINLSPTFVQAHFNRGLAYSAMGRHQRAVEDYDRALILTLETPSISRQTIFPLLLGRALALFNSGRFTEALTDLDSALQVTHPDSPEAEVIRGVALGESGKIDSSVQSLTGNGLAIEDLSLALRINPQASNVFYTRGLAFLYLSQYVRSVAYFDETIRRDPQSVEAYTGRGRVNTVLNNQDQAIRDFSKAIQLDPSSADSHRNRALSYASLGMEAQALQDVKKAVELGADAETLNRAVDELLHQSDSG